MQSYVPTDVAAPILRPRFFGPDKSVVIVNQSPTDVYMSDNPMELNASPLGIAPVGGVRIANGGGQVLWPSTATVAWFKAIEPWVAGVTYSGTGATIVDKLGGVWQVTTAGTTGASYPFPATEPAIGGTQADNTVTWTFRGVNNAIALQIMPG